jgi:hypothetical protein
MVVIFVALLDRIQISQRFGVHRYSHHGRG